MASKKSKAEERAERARQFAAQQARSQRRGTLLKGTGVVVVVLIIVAVCVVVGLKKNGGDGGGGSSTPAAATMTAGSSKYGLLVGSTVAPHKVVIFEDFVCPICGEFEKTSHAELAQLADEGKVYIDYRPFHLFAADAAQSPYTERALETFGAVTLTSTPEIAKAFHDLLYANQPDEEGPYLSQAKITALAVQAGADQTKVEAALADGSAKKWAKAATNEAFADGVQGTPTVILDGNHFTQGTDADSLAQNLIAAVS